MRIKEYKRGRRVIVSSSDGFPWVGVVVRSAWGVNGLVYSVRDDNSCVRIVHSDFVKGVRWWDSLSGSLSKLRVKMRFVYTRYIRKVRA